MIFANNMQTGAYIVVNLINCFYNILTCKNMEYIINDVSVECQKKIRIKT